ncbi:hypothetical protein O3Q51_12905 [Cryomorphaceae bacterium 1068]|nr:hypothetical protein [Cryomorphaceae bacterium 1068]
MNGKKPVNWVVLLVHLLVIVLYHNLVYIGHYGYDDMEYARAAVNLLNGEPDFSNHFSHRVSVTGPTAVAFAIFGVTDTGATLPALVFSFLLAFLVTSLLWKKGPIALSIGLSLALLPQWFLFYTDKLMPDMTVAFFVFATVVFYWRGINSFGRRKAAYGAVFSLSLLLGFLAKGTIVLALPWALFIFAIDLFRRREKSFWLAAVGSGALFLGVYFLATWWLTGSFFSRFTAIAGNAYMNACSYAELPSSFLLERVTKGFWEMGIQYGLLPGMIFLIAGLIGKKFRLIGENYSLLRYSLLTGIVFLLSANFMTISPTAYNPMCLDVRHYLFLTPILALVAALVFSKYISAGRYNIVLPMLAIAFALLAYQIDNKEFEKLWLPIAGVILLGFVPIIRRKAGFLFPILTFGVMLILPWEMFSFSDQVKYREQREWIVEQLEKLENGSTIYTSPVQERLTRFYLRFDSSEIKVRRYSDLEKAYEATNQNYLLFNPYTLQLSGMNNDQLPYTALYPTETSRLLERDEKTGMELYQIEEVISPRSQGTAIVSILEVFDSASPSELEFKTENFVEKTGRSAYKLEEYSGTFRVPFDSISALAEKYTFALIDLDAYAEANSNLRIVISIEKNGIELFRDDVYLLKQGFIFGTWNTVNAEVRLPLIEEKGCELLTYIWNPEGDTMYIDNLHLSIISM